MRGGQIRVKHCLAETDERAGGVCRHCGGNLTDGEIGDQYLQSALGHRLVTLLTFVPSIVYFSACLASDRAIYTYFLSLQRI